MPIILGRGLHLDRARPVTMIIALFIAPLVLLTCCFAIEVLVGLKPLGAPTSAGVVEPNAVIVVPAHDEEQLLEATLEQLKLSAEGQARILVVADNCSDATAEIARRFGVDVIERDERDRKGKGFALDFARAYLRSSPPDVVVVVDADCSIDCPSIGRLVHACAGTGRPCQATNLQRPVTDGSLRVQLSTFAFFIKNVIRQRALERLANRVHLLGTGMAFPWSIFSKAQLATSAIVEDLKLGQDLADAGFAAILVEDATVWSNAETLANTISQRRRWEGGFLENALRSGPRMVAKAVASARPRLLWAAIDTMIPPLTLLILLNGAMLVLAAGLVLVSSASAWPAIVLCGACLLAGFALTLAWLRGGSRFVTLRGLLQAPLYVAWKLPMYAAFALRGTPKEWMRTARDRHRDP